MSRASSVVEINGNRYDAATGQLLGSVKKSAHQLKSSASGVVDGFIRQSSQVSTKKRAVKNRAKHTAQTFHSTTERSRTLMRTAVTKPEPRKAAVKNTASAISADGPKFHNKHSFRARSVQQHKKISRFGHVHKPAPAPSTAKTGQVIPKAANRTAAVHSAVPSLTASASHSHIERLLDQALAAKPNRASSGRPLTRQGLLHRIRLMPKWLTVGASALVLTTAAGLFAWQNIPQVAVKVASSRASVNASAPAYTPEGYRFSAPISYTKGLVTVRYQSANGQSYEITQQSSRLDSTSLASTVLSSEANVQTSQVKGNTVYIYGDKNDATWVNNGVRYTIVDNAGLDSNQILRIAGSL